MKRRAAHLTALTSQSRTRRQRARAFHHPRQRADPSRPPPALVHAGSCSSAPPRQSARLRGNAERRAAGVAAGASPRGYRAMRNAEAAQAFLPAKRGAAGLRLLRE